MATVDQVPLNEKEKQLIFHALIAQYKDMQMLLGKFQVALGIPPVVSEGVQGEPKASNSPGEPMAPPLNGPR